MKLSVIVVSYAVRDLLERCLASLTRPEEGVELEIIVVDNASADATASLVRERFPGVRLLALERNRGFGVAANAGARLASGDRLFFLNPDTEALPGSLSRIALALERHVGAVAVGFRQVDAQGQLQLSLGLTPGFASELVRCAVQRRLDRGDRWLAAALDQLLSFPLPVPWVSGATLLVRRADFERQGGFDERFFLYFEDIDLCLRLRAQGGRIYYDPTVTLIHHRGRSAAGAKELARRAYRKSQLYFWEKHRGPWARRLVHAFLKLRGEIR
jgi:GT2 family glycosyltransferase